VDSAVNNKEGFMEVVRQQYSEEIREAHQANEHGQIGSKKVDMPGLNKRLQNLMANAKVEGLPTEQFKELARANLPEEIAERVELGMDRKAA
jgi:hypothetical protein